MLHPHTARDDDELSFNVNDEITVIEKGKSGWWRGRLGDQEGLFPSSYVSMVAKDYRLCKLRALKPLLNAQKLRRCVGHILSHQSHSQHTIVGATVSDFGLPRDLLAEIDFLV